MSLVVGTQVKSWEEMRLVSLLLNNAFIFSESDCLCSSQGTGMDTPRKIKPLSCSGMCSIVSQRRVLR